MKKRILTCLLALLAVLTMMVPAWAEQTEDDIFIYDTAGLLNEDEWLELEMLADEISWRYRCAVYIVTVEDYEDYGSDPYDAAANIYNENDFGIGEGRDGILLLQSTWGRDYGLYIRDGYANSMVGKYARTLLEDAFLDDFADDDYRGGYEDYLSTCADFFERAGPVQHAGRLHSADRRELYHTRPGRGIRLKEQRARLGYGRTGHRIGVGAAGVPDAEGKNEVRSSGRGGGRLCDRRGPQSDGAV